jgi:flagellar biosynthesis protein FlhB
MKTTSFLIIAIVAVPCQAFQFMSKLKMPTRDPNAEKIKERFGDKSE